MKPIANDTLKAGHPTRGGPEGGALARARRLGQDGARQMMIGQCAKAAFRIGFSGTAAFVLGQLIMGEPMGIWPGVVAVSLLAFAALASFATDHLQAIAERSVAAGVRDFAFVRLRTMELGRARSLSIGQTVTGLQRYPTAIASLVVGHHVARTMMAAGPSIAAVALVFVSWQATLVVAALTPIMIVFFVLVGGTIRKRADAQEAAFGHLAGQFADRIRTLPTILANDALAVEEGKLAIRLEAYAAKTMHVLGIAFLNAGIIDFFASLSIAILAVLLGLGHLRLLMLPGFSDLQLWQSLFILMIAPEYFSHFRRFAEQYHAKAEGEAAAATLDALLSSPAPVPPTIPALDEACAGVMLPERGLVVISGPSGSGKSSLLRRLSGLDAPDRTFVAPLADRDLTWVAMDSFIPAGTLGAAIAWNAGRSCRTRLIMAADRCDLLDDALLPGGLDAIIEANGANLSGGQRLRIAIARSLVSNRIVIADEPTAKLDEKTAATIRRAIVEMARTRLVVVATHDHELERAADLRIPMDVSASATSPEVAA